MRQKRTMEDSEKKKFDWKAYSSSLAVLHAYSRIPDQHHLFWACHASLYRNVLL